MSADGGTGFCTSNRLDQAGGLLADSCGSLVVSSNWVTRCAAGIDLENSLAVSSVAYNVITDGGSSGYGVLAFNPLAPFEVTGNRITNCYVGAAAIAGEGNLITLSSNVIEQTSIGTLISDDWWTLWGFPMTEVNCAAVLRNNLIHNAATGVYILQGTATVTASGFGNSLEGGVYCEGTGAALYDFSGNWWGVNIPAGVAGQLVGNVDYTPWLDAGANASAGPGFQGDFSVLHVSAASPQAGGAGRIQEALGLLFSGTLYVHNGAYTEGPQLLIGNNVTVIGDATATTLIKPAGDTANAGDAKGWWLVQSGKTFNLSEVTLDGTGKKVFQAIRSYGLSTIDRVHFTHIQYNASGPDYAGTGVVGFDDGVTPATLTVSNCQLDNIGRIGALYFGNTTGNFSGNTYTGKGPGDWLDYGIEVGAGASATILDNSISGNNGVASVTAPRLRV